jgi:hypothetical protein
LNYKLIKDGPSTLATSIPGVFTGGDAVIRLAAVIGALAAGRKAIVSIRRYLNGQYLIEEREGEGTQDSPLQVETESAHLYEWLHNPGTASPFRRKPESSHPMPPSGSLSFFPPALSTCLKSSPKVSRGASSFDGCHAGGLIFSFFPIGPKHLRVG